MPMQKMVSDLQSSKILYNNKIFSHFLKSLRIRTYVIYCTNKTSKIEEFLELLKHSDTKHVNL